jgi:hypothetical protein
MLLVLAGWPPFATLKIRDATPAQRGALRQLLLRHTPATCVHVAFTLRIVVLEARAETESMAPFNVAIHAMRQVEVELEVGSTRERSNVGTSW